MVCATPVLGTCDDFLGGFLVAKIVKKWTKIKIFHLKNILQYDKET